MAACNERVGRGAITWPCTLDADHQGPCFAVESSASAGDRRRWAKARDEAAAADLAHFQGPAQTTAERYTENPTPVPVSPGRARQHQHCSAIKCDLGKGFEDECPKYDSNNPGLLAQDPRLTEEATQVALDEGDVLPNPTQRWPVPSDPDSYIERSPGGVFFFVSPADSFSQVITQQDAIKMLAPPRSHQEQNQQAAPARYRPGTGDLHRHGFGTYDKGGSYDHTHPGGGQEHEHRDVDPYGRPLLDGQPVSPAPPFRYCGSCGISSTADGHLSGCPMRMDPIWVETQPRPLHSIADLPLPPTTDPLTGQPLGECGEPDSEQPGEWCVRTKGHDGDHAISFVSNDLDFSAGRTAVPTKQRPGDQVLPDGNESLVDDQALVIADIEARRQVGIERYGQGHRPFNGRNTMLDAYEETLDLLVYWRSLLRTREAAREDLIKVVSAEFEKMIGGLFQGQTGPAVAEEMAVKAVDRVMDWVVGRLVGVQSEDLEQAIKANIQAQGVYLHYRGEDGTATYPLEVFVARLAEALRR